MKTLFFSVNPQQLGLLWNSDFFHRMNFFGYFDSSLTPQCQYP